MPFLLPAILFPFGGVALRDVTRGIEYCIVGIFVPEKVRSKQDQRFSFVLFSFLCRHYKLNHVRYGHYLQSRLR